MITPDYIRKILELSNIQSYMTTGIRDTDVLRWWVDLAKTMKVKYY